MYFLQISDTHHMRSYATNTDCFRESLMNLEDVEYKLKNIKDTLTVPLDFICHCGDVTHGGEMRDYQLIRDAIKRCFPSVPIVVTTGNHDNKGFVQQAFYGKITPLFATDDTIGDLRILAFDNTDGFGGCGQITSETCDWLIKSLEQQPDQPTILVCHHHLIQGQFPMPPAVIDPIFSQILKQKQILAILNGHTHHHYQGMLEEIPCYTVGSLSFRARDLGAGLLHIFDSSDYHLFSYENNILTLEEVGNLGFYHYLGKAQFS